MAASRSNMRKRGKTKTTRAMRLLLLSRKERQTKRLERRGEKR